MKVKVFSCNGARIDILEDEINDWLAVNKEINIINIISTSNATADGADSSCIDKLYLIVIYDR